MACDAEDCGFQMLNDDEIVTSAQEEYDPVDDETDEDEANNNNESSKGPSNADLLLEMKFEFKTHRSQISRILRRGCLLTHEKATQGLLARELVLLTYGQVKKTTTGLEPSLEITAPRQREDFESRQL
ncbi:hypothetical protein TNCV_1309651 [Trichonephila clavipes]|nr:hypothetical protein TNCV_1309651 [Trichonephila clavipes]